MSQLADLLNGSYGDNSSFLQPGMFVQGKVLDIANKEHKGLVKVEFTVWEAKKNIVEWIPVMRSYAGKDYGYYVMPEVGNIVIVGFLSSDMKKPFVLGLLYPADNSFIDENWVDKNTTRRWKFKGGLDFKLSSEEKKESITVMTPKGQTIKIEDETDLITISNKNGKDFIKLDSKNGKLEISVEKNISLTTGQCKLTMDGDKGEITITAQKVTIEGKQGATLKSSGNTTVEGGVLTAEGKQTAAFKGGTMAQLKGGLVQIN